MERLIQAAPEGGALDGHLPIPHIGPLEQLPPWNDDEAVVPSGLGRSGSEDAEWVANGIGQWCGGESEPKAMEGHGAGGDRRFGGRILGTH